MPFSSLPVEHLFTLTAEIDGPPAVVPDGPSGTRVLVHVTGGSFDGPRLRGRIAKGPGGDWATMRADGTVGLDVRLLLETDDGAHVLMTYRGVARPSEGGLEVRAAPVFEAGDERYTWLNHVQAVALGQTDGSTVRYEVYALA